MGLFTSTDGEVRVVAAAGVGTIVAQFNTLLAELRAHGIIDTEESGSAGESGWTEFPPT